MTTTGFMKRLLKEQPTRLLLVVATLAIAGLLEGGGIALLVPLLQLVSAQNSDQAAVGKLGILTTKVLALAGLTFSLGNVLALIFFIALVLQLVTLLQQRLSFRYQYLFEAALRERLYKAIFSAQWSFFIKQKSGNMTNALTTEVGRAGSAFYLLNQILAAVIVTVVYIGLAFRISWQMAASASFFGAAVMLALQSQISRAHREGQDVTYANRDLQSEAIEQISGAKLVKGCAVEEATIGRFRKNLRALAEAQFRTNYNGARLKAVHELTITGLLCFGIYMAVTALKMPIATLIVFLIIFYRLAPRLSNVQTFRRGLISCLPAFDQIDSLIEQAEALKEGGGTYKISKLGDGIVLKDVDFAYNPGHPVIKRLNLSIPKGKTVAFVGTSGAGKSTLVDLIMGLIQPISGSVLVDGRPLVEHDLKSWRRLIGYVAQDAVLFHASVKANISWTVPEASLKDVEAAAEAAYASDFIERFPEGFDTIVGDRGLRLSGGQKQRLALAAALIRKPEILILDEATSALDAESEQKIQTAIESLAQSEMTIIVVTHRLATVKNADIIYVVEEGELIEEGNWDSLVEEKGRFQKLKHLQALD